MYYAQRDDDQVVEMSDITKFRQLFPGRRHAAHAVLYSPAPDDEIVSDMEPLQLIWRAKFFILMQMRFDGMLGFPGGLVELGENLIEAIRRECIEEHGLGNNTAISFEQQDYAFTTLQRDIAMHCFVKQISHEQMKQIERSSLDGDYGRELMGIVRVPLYSFGGKVGFQSFLQNAFVGCSRDQLISGIAKKKLVDEKTLLESIESAGLKVYKKTLQVI
ncbi:nudix (nucleoside diphosphate linked moiety X)-type motif [Cichlidogyrus casuarinus]|uniref:U8 snoRNA-decapping enzyme n=1 Tax=Cichlidogyrus casuarinus TaxID=1844966 RepID=A0ABD2Q4A2_9PLAT